MDAYKTERHVVWYGRIALERAYCQDCKQFAFVIDDTLQCCYRNAPQVNCISRQERASEAPSVRLLPPIQVRRTLLREQDNKCLYCCRRFGTQVWRGRKVIVLSVAWDHKVPFAYAQNNGLENFVAACQICNRLKGSIMFYSLEEARVYLYNRQIEKGYSTVSPMWRELHPQETLAKILQPEVPAPGLVPAQLPKNFVTMDMI